MKLQPKGLWKIIGALGIAIISFSAAMLGGKNTIPSITQLDRSIFTDQLIERGKNLMALGNCQGCHTIENGQVNAGGRAIETPFGVVYSTNITPDIKTGIGTWSFSAFQRAMQHGISKDGSYLYPAFPYTSYTKMTEEDVMSLYAFLMTQKPIFAPQTKTELTFPFNIRPFMVFWNALFLNQEEFPHNPKQSVQWIRGAYLVNTVGHCTACHSPRNILGAEKSGTNYLSGNLIDGWEAPALNRLNQSPIAWDEAELYRYLRTGITQQHGMAGGPMAEVVTQLSSANETDVQAMAHYLSTINNSSPAERFKNISDIPIKPIFNSGQRIFEMACSACHQQPSTNLINTVESGSNIPLQLNSQLHSEQPDNLIRTILDGINRPATDRIGYMPAFKNSLSNQQIADLISYMREYFAPDKNSWTGLEPHIKSLRK
jgi:nicotinate dehydrogenase subunit B